MTAGGGHMVEIGVGRVKPSWGQHMRSVDEMTAYFKDEQQVSFQGSADRVVIAGLYRALRRKFEGVELMHSGMLRAALEADEMLTATLQDVSSNEYPMVRCLGSSCSEFAIFIGRLSRGRFARWRISICFAGCLFPFTVVVCVALAITAIMAPAMWRPYFVIATIFESLVLIFAIYFALCTSRILRSHLAHVCCRWCC